MWSNIILEERKKVNETKIHIVVVVLVVGLLLTNQLPKKMLDDASDIYQVSGKYTISESKLVTKCS